MSVGNETHKRWKVVRLGEQRFGNDGEVAECCVKEPAA